MSNDKPGRDYHERTKYSRESMGGGGLEWSKKPETFKKYTDALARVPLPGPDLEMPSSLWRALAGRRSRRDYSRAAIPFDTLSQLLWATQGVTERVPGYLLRTAPSAGALYPVETYIASNRVDGLEPGIYHLNVNAWELELVTKGSKGPELADAALGQAMCGDAAAVFIWTAIPARSRWKYGERAFRYIYMDAGHIGQNLYLACEALGLACCGIGAFFDNEVNAIVGVDGNNETAVYLASVGIEYK